MTDHCGDVRAALGVYVVGAIDPAERALVDAHLAGCPACRDELAGLAGLPALLGRVEEEQLTRVAGPPPELLVALLEAGANGGGGRS
ncbi:anti-sigma factor family protein, partial [Actinomadura sp. CNU-125]|uniref:anti-sigma factor family protein n=1 Tax=Actinomadura sp. CNU-125 TaxID=1904961 RepID=UPI000AF823C7